MTTQKNGEGRKENLWRWISLFAAIFASAAVAICTYSAQVAHKNEIDIAVSKREARWFIKEIDRIERRVNLLQNRIK